ncbi:MAG: thioredoxin domain-containing protein, partial [Candidatus Babeliales bacterium]|nr:thioredoxin domain-containing protein [Candidatus Babeliales bacterium]
MNFKHTIKSVALLALISSAAYIDARKAPQKKSTTKEKSNVKEIETQQEFDTYINGAVPVLVKFYSPQCGHCKAIAAPYRELANNYSSKDIVFLAVNGDAAGDAGQIAEDYNITGYPTFVFIKDGK